MTELDPKSPNRKIDKLRYTDRIYVPIGDFFVLHPRQFVLGETLEWIHLSPTECAFVTSRSSWGRDGLVIATAIGVHPTYTGILTLELTNVGEIPLKLYPGLAIAQLFIAEVTRTGPLVPSPSMFSVSTRPEIADPAQRELDMIDAFARYRGLEQTQDK